MLVKSLIVGSLLSLVCSCTWVKPTPNTQKIQLATEADVVNCVKKGVTVSKTLGSIVWIPRNREKVRDELVILAKREAPIMGGDTIVPVGNIEKGHQDFVVYRCHR